MKSLLLLIKTFKKHSTAAVEFEQKVMELAITCRDKDTAGKLISACTAYDVHLAEHLSLVKDLVDL